MSAPGPARWEGAATGQSYAREQHVAAEAVAEAAALCARVRAELGGARALSKEDRSPVTAADFGSQALICRRLAEAFPGDAIVAEERAEALRRPEHAPTLAAVAHHVRQLAPEATPDAICAWIDSGAGPPGRRFWALDPIDGTKGFLRGGQYAVALALIEDGEVRLGALACPALPLGPGAPAGRAGALFVAVRGRGVGWAPLLGGGPLRPLAGAPGQVARRLAESVETGHGDRELQEAVAQAVGLACEPLRMDSQAKYAAVARGDAALYLRLPSRRTPGYREAIWDHAAGALIVEEAGGQVTDMRGAPLDFRAGRRLEANRGVVASRGVSHAAALAALAGAR